jgi:Asp-tRNA(Asn)/Glu-tRNA(Gln) amidotransferase C subunit
LSRGGGGGGGAAKIEPISPAELAHLAQLSHLSLPSTEAGRAALLSDVESVVEWVGTISALNHLDAQYAPMYTPLELPEYYAAAAARTTEPQAPSSDSKASNSSSPSSASVSAEDLSDPSRRDGVRLRPDVVADGGLEKQLLANASFKHRGFFVVPKVVDLEDS